MDINIKWGTGCFIRTVSKLDRMIGLWLAADYINFLLMARVAAAPVIVTV